MQLERKPESRTRTCGRKDERRVHKQKVRTLGESGKSEKTSERPMKKFLHKDSLYRSFASTALEESPVTGWSSMEKNDHGRNATEP